MLNNNPYFKKHVAIEDVIRKVESFYAEKGLVAVPGWLDFEGNHTFTGWDIYKENDGKEELFLEIGIRKDFHGAPVLSIWSANCTLFKGKENVINDINDVEKVLVA